MLLTIKLHAHFDVIIFYKECIHNILRLNYIKETGIFVALRVIVMCTVK